MDLAQVYETYVAKIYNYIFFRVLHKEIAEDLVSSVFLKVAEHFASYNPEKGAVSTWLYTIAENTLADYFRSRRVVPISFDDLAASDEPSVDFDEQSMLIQDENRRELYNALFTLNEPTRNIIARRYFLEMSLKQIAEDLGMNENTVYTMHRRGLEALKQKVGVTM